MWADCMAIAKARRQRLSEVVRAALVAYRQDNRALLDEIRAAETGSD